MNYYLCFLILIVCIFHSCNPNTDKQAISAQSVETNVVKTNTVDTLTAIIQDTVALKIAGKKLKIYPLIIKSATLPGKINTEIMQQLPTSIRAVAALYAALGGSLCDGETCQLTTALDLGNQGSAKHKGIIAAYFKDDKVAKAVLEQDCFLRPSGANAFSEFEYLTIYSFNDTVKVDYSLVYYNEGRSTTSKGPYLYAYKANTFKVIKREIWKQFEQ